MLETIEEQEEIMESGKTFDFTETVELMDTVTKSVYYRLRRIAILANNEQGDSALLPDGKILTEADVIAALGPDYEAEASIMRECCG